MGLPGQFSATFNNLSIETFYHGALFDGSTADEAAIFDFRNDLNANQFQDPIFSVSYAVTAVPLPASLPLMAAGIFGLGMFRKRKAA